jgi:hypothetical protein
MRGWSLGYIISLNHGVEKNEQETENPRQCLGSTAAGFSYFDLSQNDVAPPVSRNLTDKVRQRFLGGLPPSWLGKITA